MILNHKTGIEKSHAAVFKENIMLNVIPFEFYWL